MKLKNKNFFIIALFFCIILSFATLSQAFTFDYEGKHYDVPNFPADNNNYHLLVDFEGSLSLFTSSKPITYLDSSTYTGYGEVYGDNGILYRISGVEWKVATKYGTDFWRSNSNNKKYFVYSNYDILDKNSGNLVFQKAPLQMVVPMEVGKVEELPTLIIQIVEMIIPAFLIIFGTLLVLYLIKSKNLLQL